MSSKFERYYNFMVKEKTKCFLAFAIYFSIVGSNMFPSILFSYTLIFITIISIGAYSFHLCKVLNEIQYTMKQKVKKIIKEIVMYIPVSLISTLIIYLFFVGEPANQINLNEAFKKMPILILSQTIIFGPIIEELIYRYLPYYFIKNKTLYIIISSIIFAASHVIHDPNAFYYIWFYMLGSLYLGYRYYKTKDIWVTIGIHSFHNLITALLIIF